MKNKIKIIILTLIFLSFFNFLYLSNLLSSEEITISIGSEILNKYIKPLLGVNAGPLKSLPDDPDSVDLTKEYHEIGVEVIRNHDFYQGTNKNVLDTIYLYPDESKDPLVETSYNFLEGDKLFKDIIEKGFEVYFRLGNSYSNSPSPKNIPNWIKAAVHIVDHYYNLSKSLNKPIKYVEIWNEPDNKTFWDRPIIDYFKLYVNLAKEIKELHPELKVGGPAFTPQFALTTNGKKLTDDFLKYVKENSAPLDFFSWHIYSDNPEDFKLASEFANDQLKKFGFYNTENHVTEYNIELKQDTIIFTQPKSASLTTASWINLQEEDIKASFYYRGNDPKNDKGPWVGLFWADGKYKPTALAFFLWSKLCKYEKMLNVSVDNTNDIKVLAGKNSKGEIGILIANISNREKNINFNINGFVTKNLEFNVSEINDDGTKILNSQVKGKIIVKPYGVQFITFNQYKKEKIVIVLKINDKFMLVNGEKKEIDPGRGTYPIILNGRTLLPIRAVVEALGGSVEWIEKEEKVTIDFNNTKIELWIGKNSAKVDGVYKSIDPNNPNVVPIIINGRTMLPLRFIAENLGCVVDWDSKEMIITITFNY